jgi:hypothetical protein
MNTIGADQEVALVLGNRRAGVAIDEGGDDLVAALREFLELVAGAQIFRAKSGARSLSQQHLQIAASPRHGRAARAR